jgi:hypothetical protein
MRHWCILALAVTFAASAEDLESVKAQSNLEKRSEMALVYADSALAEAKTAWRQGETKEFTVKLDDVREAVVLSLDSLQKTGRPPNKLVKWYKSAELKTRELSRRLESFAEEVSLEDRPAVQKVNERVQAVHEEFLLGVLSRKK